MNNELECIFIVFGKIAKEDLSNVKSINTKVIPNIGETIVYDRTRYKVINKVIDYSNVQNYSLGDTDRGGEYMYIFLD